MPLMTKNDFIFLIETKKPYEFTFNNVNYNITYGKDEKGEYIAFGERYFQKKYYSYGELMNNAWVENHYFKELIEDLEL